VYEEVSLEEDDKALRTYLEDAGIVISASDRLLSIDEILKKMEIYRDLVLGYPTNHSSDYSASLVHDYILSCIDIAIDGLRHYTALPVPCSAFDFEPEAGDGDCSCVNHDVINDLSNGEAPVTAGDQSLSERLSVAAQPIFVNQANHIPDEDGLETHDVYGTGECRDARTDTPVATYSQPASSFKKTDPEYVVPDILSIASPDPLCYRNTDAHASNQVSTDHHESRPNKRGVDDVIGTGESRGYAFKRPRGLVRVDDPTSTWAASDGDLAWAAPFRLRLHPQSHSTLAEVGTRPTPALHTVIQGESGGLNGTSVPSGDYT
jgi:hypothetical protein